MPKYALINDQTNKVNNLISHPTTPPGVTAIDLTGNSQGVSMEWGYTGSNFYRPLDSDGCGQDNLYNVAFENIPYDGIIREDYVHLNPSSSWEAHVTVSLDRPTLNPLTSADWTVEGDYELTNVNHDNSSDGSNLSFTVVTSSGSPTNGEGSIHFNKQIRCEKGWGWDMGPISIISYDI